jgi:hypothetical protein
MNKKITYKVIQPPLKETGYSICHAFYKGDLFCEFVLHGNRISQYRLFWCGVNEHAVFGSLNALIKKL